MSSFTYPVRHPEGPVNDADLKLMLGSSEVIARRVAELTNAKFIADFILTGRFNAQGGGVFYEEGAEPLTSGVAPEAVEPAGEYPLVHLEDGPVSSAATVKWGQATRFTDEKITREGLQYVERGLSRIGNGIIQQVDNVAWGVISSRVTSTFAATGAWTSAGTIMRDILTVQGERSELATGLQMSTVALSIEQYAKLIGILVDDGALPREQGNIVLSGSAPVQAFGVTWVTSPFIVGSDPWLFDTAALGGMADEQLLSPEFAAAGPQGVEAMTGRVAGVDVWQVRARRVTVPVVTEPLAGVRITGTGL